MCVWMYEWLFDINDHVCVFECICRYMFEYVWECMRVLEWICVCECMSMCVGLGIHMYMDVSVGVFDSEYVSMYAMWMSCKVCGYRGGVNFFIYDYNDIIMCVIL